MIDRTDEETGELVRAWLQRYGLTIIAGIVLAIALIGVYEWWQNHQLHVKQERSAQLMAIEAAVAANDVAKAEGLYAELDDDGRIKQLAALLLASSIADKEEKRDAAEAYLHEAKTSEDALVAQTAKWQLAQIQIAAKDYDAAESTLQTLKGSAYDGQIPLLRAVMAQLKGDNQSAMDNYQQALAENPNDSAFITAQIAAVEGAMAVDTGQQEE